jgi:acyl carrier protein
MGLDAVELVMALEEEFGISIDDRSAEHMTTPRHVIEFIMARAGTENGPRCLSMKAFHRLRGAMTNSLRVQRKMVRREMKLESLLPWRDRLMQWERLRDAVEMTVWPRLVRPRAVVYVIATLALATFGICWWAQLVVHPNGPRAAFMAASIIVGSGVGYVCNAATRSLKLAIPFEQNTVEKLVRFMALYSGGLGDPRVSRWTRGQIAERVRQITIEQLGINQSQYDEDARFIEDLGMS